MYIYKITNKITGKVYIGQTVHSIESRFKRHCSANSGCTFIRNAIKKHGKENFTIECLDTASTLDELNTLEGFYIEKYGSLAPNGYNLCGSGQGFTRTKETRQRMSMSRVGIQFSPAHLENLTKALRGRKCRPQTENEKKARRESQLGEKSKTAKLSDTDVLHIKELLKQGVMGKDIAQKFGVSKATISSVKNNKRWEHV